MQAAGPSFTDAQCFAGILERFAFEIGTTNELTSIVRQLVDCDSERMLELVIEKAFEGHFGLVVGDFDVGFALLASLAEEKNHGELSAHAAEPPRIIRRCRG